MATATQHKGKTEKQSAGRAFERKSLRKTEPAVVPAIEALKLLQTHLGRPLVAITLGVTASSVDRYLRGDSRPQHDTEQRIHDSYNIWQMIAAVDSPATTRAWWMGMKDQLGDLSPAEAIAAGQARAVKSVARDFVEGG